MRLPVDITPPPEKDDPAVVEELPEPEDEMYVSDESDEASVSSLEDGLLKTTSYSELTYSL